MLDLSHIPNSQQDVRIFHANGSAWQMWQKPRKCNYVWIMCVGGAGGGGGGSNLSNFIWVSGGGSGAVTRALYNAQQLPDILYVQVGLGGGGGIPGISTQGGPGSSGTRSAVSLQPVFAAQNHVAISGNAAATGGNYTPGSVGETASAQATATFYSLSNFISTAGVGSSNPGNGTGFANITPFTSQITTPGAGATTITAGNKDGASILATSITPIISGGLGSASGNAENGANGITSYKPFYSLGGAGGGTSSAGIGGNGGNGGIGSGGGGGGSGSSGGGTGGKGGDGLVIIISF